MKQAKTEGPSSQGKSNKKRYREHNIEHQIVIDEKYMLRKYNNDQSPIKLNNEEVETAADLPNQKSPSVLQERSTEGKKKKQQPQGNNRSGNQLQLINSIISSIERVKQQNTFQVIKDEKSPIIPQISSSAITSTSIPKNNLKKAFLTSDQQQQ